MRTLYVKTVLRTNFVYIMEVNRKRRRLCEHCNQLLARTTYWEHQKRFKGVSSERRAAVNTAERVVSESSDSEFGENQIIVDHEIG